MASSPPSPLDTTVEHAEPLSTSTSINFRTSSNAPSAEVTQPPATYPSSPLLKPEMGLAVETWLHILSFLSCDRLALLACALTCRCLRGPAQDMIHTPCCLRISTYHDLDTFFEKVCRSPALAVEVEELDIRAKDNMTSIPVFSAVPFRLARKLIRLETLRIGASPNGHSTIAGLSCAWSFYGRAFACVTTLEFRDVGFPSFFDFISLVNSFPALTTLLIHDVGCRSRKIPVSVRKRHHKRPFKLERLTLSESTLEWSARVWFLQTLAWWLIHQRASVKTLNINNTIPIRRGLLEGLPQHLQRLELRCPVTKSPLPGGQWSISHIRRLVPISMLLCLPDLDFSGSQFPLLTHLAIYDVRSEGVPWLRAKLPLIFSSIKSCRRLEITVNPLETDLHSSAWKVLDVVVFAFQFLARHTFKSRLNVSLNSSTPWSVYGVQVAKISDHLQAFETTQFPLASSCSRPENH